MQAEGFRAPRPLRRTWRRTPLLLALALLAVLVSGSLADARTFTGTSTTNRVIGTGSADTIQGLSGADTMHGLGGADTLYGNAGNDVLVGESGKDVLVGGDGDDVIVGSDDDELDRLDGGGGFDDCVVSKGDNVRNCEY